MTQDERTTLQTALGELAIEPEPMRLCVRCFAVRRAGACRCARDAYEQKGWDEQ